MNQISDYFAEDIAPGQVIGKQSSNNVLRRGVDKESVISIDHDALRIQPLRQPGWGRAGLAYGPYQRKNGLAFGVHILNGHNTSQAGHLEVDLLRRLWRWVRGSGSNNFLSQLLRWSIKGKKKFQWRQLQRWVTIDRQYRNGSGPQLDENLAIGWFSQESPDDPSVDGHSFIMHATGPENGELWCTIGNKVQRLVSSLQNIPFYYIVVLRDRGAAYYAATLPGAHGLCGFPEMRPLAIDHTQDDEFLYAGVHQSVMGQIGFRVDTRVFSAHVAEIDAFSNWYGSAHAAHRFSDQGISLNGIVADIGGKWQSAGSGEMHILNPDKQSGLVHTTLSVTAELEAAGVVWRYLDPANFWQLKIDEKGCHIYRCDRGEHVRITTCTAISFQAGNFYAIQIADQGEHTLITVNGEVVLTHTQIERQLRVGTGVGIFMSNAPSIMPFHTFEAHPRTIPIPPNLPFAAPWLPQGQSLVVKDDFYGQERDLSQHFTSFGDVQWQRTLGNGVFRIEAEAGRVAVQACPENPLIERTAYTIPWPQPDFADISVYMTPPGSDHGQWEKGRGGIIFWQDAQNYIIINTWLDDYYEGASISSFFFLNGFEEIFDAVWTNVGKRITWGVRYKLRVVFDGIQYQVYVNDEPVLYRALTDVYPDSHPIIINRVGLVANWEWGHDTGTRFDSFEAKAE